MRELASSAFIGETVAKRANEQLLAASNREAAKHIRTILAGLTAAHFCESKQLAYKEDLSAKRALYWFDVYGVEDNEGRWYVKFRIDQDGLLVVSCHGPTEDMRLPNGRVIKKWTS